MLKDIMTHNESVTPDGENIAFLKEKFPACFHPDGAFDLTRFAECLHDKVNVTREGYELRFLGKDYAKLLASLETETIIQPDIEHNSKPENKNSDNIYISGDNLDALKHLLKSYAGKIKCIYIDPPYNTGSDDFVYRDSFNFSAEELQNKLDLDEKQAERLLAFTKRGSTSHSAWLMFMYPRLQLARELLSKDGVIFISIDDNEQANLKLLCDDVFGEENFIGEFIWKKRQMVDSRTQNGVSKDHDYLLCFGHNEMVRIQGKESDKTKYSNPDKDPRGDWMSADMSGLATESQRPHLHYVLKDPATEIEYACPKTGWRYEPSRMTELLENNEIIFPENPTGRPRRKKFLKDVESSYTGFSTILATVFSTQGTREVRDLFSGKEVFDFPKPVDYIKMIIQQGEALDGAEKDFWILDFFSGSATSAHAVMQRNADDAGNRKYIMVQLPELCKENSEAYKAGFRTIDEIGRKRIELAAAKIREENPLFHGDLGFKHYTLATPPENTLDKMVEFKPEADDLIATDEMLAAVGGRDVVLTTWLVRDGYGFAPAVKAVKLHDYTAWWCNKHLYLIDPGFTEEDVAELFRQYDSTGEFSPETVVLFGYSFNEWTVNEMLDKNLRQLRDSGKQLKINLEFRY